MQYVKTNIENTKLIKYIRAIYTRRDSVQMKLFYNINWMMIEVLSLSKDFLISCKSHFDPKYILIVV